MKDRRAILSIGDLHGREDWKTPLFGSVSAHAQWEKESREHGILGEFMSDIYPIGVFDKVIFVGDYVDSFDKSNIEIKHNLEQIVYLKEIFPEKVVLLIGNHDLQYIHGTEFYCSGCRPEMKHDLHQLLTTRMEGKSIFQAAYQEGRWLWTHAGMTKSFQVDCLEGFKKISPTARWKDFYREDMNEADLLNLMYDFMHPDIFRVSFSRGGHSPIPGTFWTDKKELYDKPAVGVSQIVGHSRVKEIRAYGYNRTTGFDQIFFIDNLDEGSQFLATVFEETVINFPLHGYKFESVEKIKQNLFGTGTPDDRDTLDLMGNKLKI